MLSTSDAAIHRTLVTFSGRCAPTQFHFIPLGKFGSVLLLRFNLKDTPLWWLNKQDIPLFQP